MRTSREDEKDEDGEKEETSFQFSVFSAEREVPAKAKRGVFATENTEDTEKKT